MIAELCKLVDLELLLNRHDLVWSNLPQQFDHGAFLGNGLLGVTIYSEGPKSLRFDIGCSSVTERRRDNMRLPIGGMVLNTTGPIRSGTMRIHLWNAEITGKIVTGNGEIGFKVIVHRSLEVMVISISGTDGEQNCAMQWSPRYARDFRNHYRFNDRPNPAPSNIIDGDISLWTQPREAGGSFTTAWKEYIDHEIRCLAITVVDTYPAVDSANEALKILREYGKVSHSDFLKSHRAWWHTYYGKSFLSIPDRKLESFYWIQLFKLGCASRPGRLPVDLMGPWYRDSAWARVWMNMNIQMLYLPAYVSNHLEMGESLIGFLDRSKEHFFENAKKLTGLDHCATVSHSCDNQGRVGDGSWGLPKFINPGDLVWALHNYYLHYRHSMNHHLVCDHKGHAFYPLLRGCINLYLNVMTRDEMGIIHLPLMHSPEYGEDVDTNYNLALFRWGCQTMLELSGRYGFCEPLKEKLEEVLAQLTPYPCDENGFRIGADVGVLKSHRHWSHLLMVHPLHMMACEEAQERELVKKSIDHWLTVDQASGIYAWSHSGSASLYASIGEGNLALKSLNAHVSDSRFVMPNTMYIEQYPVIESSIGWCRGLQDMLLQSWGGKIKVFPAVPSDWADVVFDQWSAEGAFLVSARRKGGKTLWIKIKSLAGEPCVIQTDMVNPQTVCSKKLSKINDTSVQIILTVGEEAVITENGKNQALEMVSLSEGESLHYWGGK